MTPTCSVRHRQTLYLYNTIFKNHFYSHTLTNWRRQGRRRGRREWEGRGIGKEGSDGRKNDVVKEGRMEGGWNMGGSVVGRSHEAKEVCRKRGRGKRREKWDSEMSGTETTRERERYLIRGHKTL